MGLLVRLRCWRCDKRWHGNPRKERNGLCSDCQPWWAYHTDEETRLRAINDTYYYSRRGRALPLGFRYGVIVDLCLYQLADRWDDEGL